MSGAFDVLDTKGESDYSQSTVDESRQREVKDLIWDIDRDGILAYVDGSSFLAVKFWATNLGGNNRPQGYYACYWPDEATTTTEAACELLEKHSALSDQQWRLIDAREEEHESGIGAASAMCSTNEPFDEWQQALETADRGVEVSAGSATSAARMLLSAAKAGATAGFTTSGGADHGYDVVITADSSAAGVVAKGDATQLLEDAQENTISDAESRIQEVIDDIVDEDGENPPNGTKLSTLETIETVVRDEDERESHLGGHGPLGDVATSVEDVMSSDAVSGSRQSKFKENILERVESAKQSVGTNRIDRLHGRTNEKIEALSKTLGRDESQIEKEYLSKFDGVVSKRRALAIGIGPVVVLVIVLVAGGLLTGVTPPDVGGFGSQETTSTPFPTPEPSISATQSNDAIGIAGQLPDSATTIVLVDTENGSRVDSRRLSESSLPIRFEGVPDGNYTVRVAFSGELAGLDRNVTVSTPVVLNLTAPAWNATVPSGGVTIAGVVDATRLEVVLYDQSGTVRARRTLNSSTLTPGESPFNLTIVKQLPKGEYLLRVDSHKPNQPSRSVLRTIRVNTTTISGVDFSTTRTVVGDEIRVNVTVENPGGLNDTLRLPLLVNGTAVRNTSVTVPPGQSRTVQFNYTFDTAGTYNVSVTPESRATVTVERETVGLNVTVNRSEVTTGENVTVAVRRTNTGAVTNGTVIVDGVSTKTGSDGNVTVSLDDPGTVTVQVEKSQTASETFTSAETNVTVFSPGNASVSSVSVTPRSVAPNETVNVSVMVTNTGGQSDTLQLSLRADGEFRKNQTVKVAPGESKSVILTTSFNTTGIRNLSVNNGSTATVSVTPGKVNLTLLSNVSSVSAGQPVEFRIRRNDTSELTAANLTFGGQTVESKSDGTVIVRLSQTGNVTVTANKSVSNGTVFESDSVTLSVSENTTSGSVSAPTAPRSVPQNSESSTVRAGPPTSQTVVSTPTSAIRSSTRSA